MKLLGIVLLMVAATLVVNAQDQDMSKPLEALKSVFRMCREVATTMISEDIGAQCKRENAKNITSNCFPEIKGERGTCVMKCLNPDAGDQEALSPMSFVEALLTKKRKMCIMEILKDCVENKTGIMMS